MREGRDVERERERARDEGGEGRGGCRVVLAIAGEKV